ncbi:Fic family protein [Candidatus Gracilibacteria bacterium]|nr:Fic family protein [Candidatus Gracilibacteria bacterium]
MKKNITSASVFFRQKWIFALGGLPNPSVKNSEWLYMLEEEMRNSLMIEGVFVSKSDLKNALSENPTRKKTIPEILGAFDAANLAYEVSYQQFQEKTFEIPKYFIRGIQAALVKLDDKYKWDPGKFREGNLVITGAKFQPPDYVQISGYLDKLVWLVEKHKTMTPWRRAALFHAFFEHIHPFPDGNGRVGRILANCILLAHGFPNISLKFEDTKEYISALEQSDKAIDDVLSGQVAWMKFDKKKIEELENIFLDRLTYQMDTLITNRFEKNRKKLISLREVAQQSGRNLNSLKVMASNKNIVSVLRKEGLFSHPDLLKNPKELD